MVPISDFGHGHKRYLIMHPYAPNQTFSPDSAILILYDINGEDKAHMRSIIFGSFTNYNYASHVINK